MRLRKRSSPEEGFQMAPMIDMVFLLLVFFMCVSSMADASRSVELDLPESEASRIPDDLEGRGVLSLDAGGQVFLGTRAVTDEALREAIRDLVRRSPDCKVVLRADRNTRFEAIRKTLKLCASEGVYQIVYATFEP
jgi:biopolymer transport protein ExbD